MPNQQRESRRAQVSSGTAVKIVARTYSMDPGSGSAPMTIQPQLFGNFRRNHALFGVMNLCHRLLEIVLEQRIGMQLANYRITQHAAGIHIGGEMFADEHSIPTYVSTNFEDRILLFWKQFRNHKRIHRSTCRMPARITETRLGGPKNE